MKTKIKIKNLIYIVLTAIIGSCQANQNENNEEVKHSSELSPNIIDFRNKEDFTAFQKMNYDSIYPNLLDFGNTPEEEQDTVIAAWYNFHKEVVSYLSDEKFDWGIPDSTIRIFNKIYFNKNGKVEHYFFDIKNESISQSTRDEFARSLKEFNKKSNFGLIRESKYAQCGSLQYINKNKK